jgi:nicotinate-nucleotide adenylyltransferase
MRIGLFGGTFDPPHAAHRAACLLAMRRLNLDRVWWLVTPGNPLKDHHRLTPLAQRVAAARALAHHPRIDVTDLEADLGTNYTFQTINYLVQRCPGVQFVWIMGADNLRHFHRWQRWRDIATLVPIAVVDRLGPSLYSAAGGVGGEWGWGGGATPWPGRAFRKRRPAVSPDGGRRHGSFCTGLSRRCRRRCCAPRAWQSAE